MNKRLFSTILIGILLLTSKCSILLEDDLSEEVIRVILPLDGTYSSIQNQVFWWETVEGTIKYSLQIMEGSFDTPIALVADTNISGDKFMIDLSPGVYEWRIRAWNTFSESEFFYSILNITDTSSAYEK